MRQKTREMKAMQNSCLSEAGRNEDQLQKIASASNLALVTEVEIKDIHEAGL